MNCDIQVYLKDKWFLRSATGDDHPDFDLIHEGDGVIDYNDVVVTLHVIEHKASGKQYGVDVIREGNEYEPNWSYNFLGEYEQREIVKTVWIEKK